jgi:hypothetical protein
MCRNRVPGEHWKVVDMDPHDTDEHASRPGFEAKDASARGVAMAGIGLMILLLFSLAVVAALFATFRQRQVSAFGPGPTPTAALPPAPRLQVNEPQDLQAVRATQESQLNTPIDRAMQLIVEHGVPTLAITPTPIPTATSTPVTSPAPGGSGS